MPELCDYCYLMDRHSPAIRQCAGCLTPVCEEHYYDCYCEGGAEADDWE